VLNKVDQVADRMQLEVLKTHHPRAVAVSALTGEGMDDLRSAVIEMLSKSFVEAEISVDASNGKLLAFLAAHSEIFHQHYDGNLVVMKAYVPKHMVEPIRREAHSLTLISDMIPEIDTVIMPTILSELGPDAAAS